MQNLFDMGHHGDGTANDDDGLGSNWWMQNLYDMGHHGQGVTGGGADDADADYMNVIFGTPREGMNTARGGPAFTPRGTLVALSQAAGKTSAAVSLGMPLQKDTHAIPEEDA